MSGSMSGDDMEPVGQDPDAPMEQSLVESGLPPKPPAVEPTVYKVMPQSRIPVSSKRGPLWKSRKDQGQRQMNDLIDAWDEAIRYYNHDQQSHRDGKDSPDYAGNRFAAKRLNNKFSSTENVVFANVNAQVPELYAKNPIVSVTPRPDNSEQTGATNESDDAFARAVERLVNVLFGMRTPPGVNLKPKAKRNVLVALLTNTGWFEVGYINKDKSSEQAFADLQALSKQLAEADDDDDIRAVEGALIALEERIEFLQPSGPFVRVRLPHQVIVDPDHNDPHLSDANWVMIEDMLPTDYINAVYGMRDPQAAPDEDDDAGEIPDADDEIVSIFEPTHILNAEGSGGDTDGDDFSLFTSDKNEYSAYGYQDQGSFNKAKRTKVWYVWDKVTRRLEMYADNDWKWPIWVWDDPYSLQGFFPLTKLWFHDNPVALFAKGEVSFYLDQQDEINEVNDEKRRARLWARRNIFFNPDMGITQDIANAVLNGPNEMAVPVRVPEGMDPNKIIFSIPPPSMQFAQQLFDKQDLYQSIDRIAATNEVERGGQFKTNTTNRAIDYYSTLGNMRMDLRLDAIEDALGDVGWKLAQLCLRFMDADTVRQLTGLDVQDFWQPLNSLQDFAKLSVSCVGGSTQKMTSQARKQEAVQVGQVLSQYLKAAPRTVIKVTLDMFGKAFDDFMISKEDWEAIDQEVAVVLQSQQGGAPGQQQGAPGQAGPPQPRPMPTGAGAGGPPTGPQGDVGQLAQVTTSFLQALPPQMLKAIGIALQQGVPPVQIFQQILQTAAGTGGGPPLNQPPQQQQPAA
jgi:hypothetical protein